MKYSNYSIQGDVERHTEVYSVIDNHWLNNLVLSQIILHKNQETMGHVHNGIEEVYFFQFGSGQMKIGVDTTSVVAGDIVLVPNGYMHKVFNTGSSDLIFHTVYNKK